MVLNSGFFLWVAMQYEYKAIEHKVAVIVPSVEDVQAAAAGRPTLPLPVPAGGRPLPATGGGGDSGSGTPPLPGALLPPGLPRPAAPRGAIAIARRRGLAPARRPRRGDGEEEGDEGEEEQEVYSRSLAWMPKSPALPAPFR
jgi:peptide/histidine transporter 3/4